MFKRGVEENSFTVAHAYIEDEDDDEDDYESVLLPSSFPAALYKSAG